MEGTAAQGSRLLGPPCHGGAKVLRRTQDPQGARGQDGTLGLPVRPPWASQCGPAPLAVAGSPGGEAECKAGARKAEVAASAHGTCPSRAQRTKSRGPLGPQALAPEAGGETAKGKCPEDQGPLSTLSPWGGRGSPRGEGGLEPASEELTVHRAGQERTGLESGHSPGLRGAPLPAPAARPHLARSPRDAGTGRRSLPAAAPAAERRKDPRARAGGRT